MQNNSKTNKKNAVKLASFSALLLAGVCIYPQEELKSTVAANNETTITISDEVFQVQSTRASEEAESISFDEQEKTNLSEEIINKIEHILF